MAAQCFCSAPRFNYQFLVRKTFIDVAVDSDDLLQECFASSGCSARRCSSAPPTFQGSGDDLPIVRTCTLQSTTKGVTTLSTTTAWPCSTDGRDRPRSYVNSTHVGTMDHSSTMGAHGASVFLQTTASSFVPQADAEHHVRAGSIEKEGVGTHVSMCHDQSGAGKGQGRKSKRLSKAKREKLKQVADCMVAEHCAQLDPTKLPRSIVNSSFAMQKLRDELRRARKRST